MDARTVLGFSIFIGLAGLVHWLVIEAIFKENWPEKEQPPSPQAVCAQKVEPGRSPTGPFQVLRSPEADQAG